MSMKVIVVDDDLSLRILLEAVCKRHGFEVVASLAEGSTLIEQVRTLKPDVVCLDQHMPGQPGLVLLMILNNAHPEVDVVMITGSDDPELEGRAADAGAAGFVRKPLVEEQIVAELKAIEENRRVVQAETAGAAATEATTAASPRITVPAAETAGVAPEAAPVNPRSVVVADDNGSVRLLLKGIVEGIGLKVVRFAGNGAEAAEMVRQSRPAMVFLDVEMPKMSGLDALPLIREASPDTQVVMVTGNASKTFVQAAIAGGAKGYILKPVRPAYVEAVVKKLLQRG